MTFESVSWKHCLPSFLAKERLAHVIAKQIELTEVNKLLDGKRRRIESRVRLDVLIDVTAQNSCDSHLEGLAGASSKRYDIKSPNFAGAGEREVLTLWTSTEGKIPTLLQTALCSTADARCSARKRRRAFSEVCAASRDFPLDVA